MAVKGVFTSDSNIVGTRKGDFAGALLQIMPTGTAQLLALSAGMKERMITDTIVHWFEENHISGLINVTNNATTGATFTVNDVSIAVVGQVYMVTTTGEYVLVKAVSGNDLTVERGFASTATTSINGSSTPVPIQRIGTAYEEGSSRPVAVANLGYPRFNYVQIFRNSWDVTRTARKIEYHTGDIVAKNQRDASMFHAEDIERSLWFGKKSIGTLNNKTYHTMDGVFTQITTNAETQGTDTTYAELNAFFRKVFEKNIKGQPNERIAFCGNSVIQVINEIARLEATIFISPGETEFGLKVHKWLTPYGDVTLMTHPLWNESAIWTEYLVVLHPAAVQLSWLSKTFDDNYDRDGTRAGVDADFGVITSELTIEYKAEKTGGKFTGINLAAKVA